MSGQRKGCLGDRGRTRGSRRRPCGQPSRPAAALRTRPPRWSTAVGELCVDRMTAQHLHPVVEEVRLARSPTGMPSPRRGRDGNDLLGREELEPLPDHDREACREVERRTPPDETSGSFEVSGRVACRTARSRSTASNQRPRWEWGFRFEVGFIPSELAQEEIAQQVVRSEPFASFVGGPGRGKGTAAATVRGAPADPEVASAPRRSAGPESASSTEVWTRNSTVDPAASTRDTRRAGTRRPAVVACERLGGGVGIDPRTQQSAARSAARPAEPSVRSTATSWRFPGRA